MLFQVIQYAHEYAQQRDRQLARMIVAEYAEAQKRGQRGRH